MTNNASIRRKLITAIRNWAEDYPPYQYMSAEEAASLVDEVIMPIVDEVKKKAWKDGVRARTLATVQFLKVLQGYDELMEE